nr:DNA-directed DNA polymerase [Tanacetum cinerariifolium]
MRIHSSSNSIVKSFTILKRCNRRRSKQIVEPELRTIVENPVVTMADTRTMSKLLQAPTEGYRDAIRDDPHSHIRWFNKITSTLKFKNVAHDAIKLMLSPFSLEGAARTWLVKEPPRSIHTWEDLVSKFVNYFFPPSNTTNLKNEITVRTSRNKPVVSKVNTTTSSSSPSLEITALTDMVKELVLMNKANQQASIKAVDEICVTCGGPHPYYECLVTDSNTFNAYAATRTYNQGGNQYHPQGDPNYHASNQMGPPGFPPPNVQNNQNYNRSLPSNIVANPRGDLKAITTQSGVSYDGPTIPPTPSPIPKKVEREIEATKDKIFQRSHFDISFADGLLHMPRFASTFKSLLSNKEKLFKLASTLLNENCSAMLLKKLPEKLVDPVKFLIPCDFSELEECLALADLGASINLMPLFVWKKLLLLELTLTCMTLELANRSTVVLDGVAEDVFVKVRKFYFPAYFIVVDYDVDPRVPLILRRPFLRMARALIDKYAQEVLGLLNSLTSGNPTPLDPIIASSSPSFTPFKGSDFILEEIKTFLRTPDELSNLDDDYYDTEGDILYLEKLLEQDPSPNLPLVKNDDLNQVDVTITKPSIEEPPKLKLKDLPSHLDYAFLEGTDKLPVIISKELKDKEKAAFLKVLKSHKQAIAWKISDIKGIDPCLCTHKVLMEDDFKPAVQHQRKVNPKIHKLIKKEVIKLLDANLIYPIFDTPWVSPVHCVPKKGGMTVIENEDNELIPNQLVTGWRVCINYRKLNDATRKDHFLFPFMEQMLERLTGNEYYCFLDGFSGYFQIPIHPQDQEKTTFTCPYGTFAYRRMPFGLCNAPSTFQRCMMAIFHDMIEETMELFMDDFSVFGDSFSSCLSHLDKMLKRKETPFIFSKECIEAFNILKKNLTEALILVTPDWDLPFEIMCDASDYAVGAFLEKRKTKHFQPIHYASKTMMDVQAHYTTTEKELLAVVYAFEKFRPYLVLSKTIVYTDHSTLKYLLAKQDAKPILLRWILLLQEYDVIIRDKKGA